MHHQVHSIDQLVRLYVVMITNSWLLYDWLVEFHQILEISISRYHYKVPRPQRKHLKPTTAKPQRLSVMHLYVEPSLDPRWFPWPTTFIILRCSLASRSQTALALTTLNNACLFCLQLTSRLPPTADVLQLTRSAFRMWAMQHHDFGVVGLEYLNSSDSAPWFSTWPATAVATEQVWFCSLIRVTAHILRVLTGFTP